MAALWARMTTNIDAAAPSSAAVSCQPRAGSPRVGSPRGTFPTTATPWLARPTAQLTLIAMITAISGPGIRRVIRRAATTITMTPIDMATSAGCTCGRARTVLKQLGQGLLARGRYPEHVRQLSGRDLDADAGQEPDQHRAGQEVRQETEPGQPGHQQHPAGQQGRQPGQPDVPFRSRHRQTGERGGEYGRGRGIRGDDEVARRTQDGEDRHRQKHRVQAGHQRHPGDLRVSEHLGDAEGGQREAGQHVDGYPGSFDGQHALQDGLGPQPSSPAVRRGSRHRLTSSPSSAQFGISSSSRRRTFSRP